jgi:hypothetical protein
METNEIIAEIDMEIRQLRRGQRAARRHDGQASAWAATWRDRETENAKSLA